MGSLEWREKTVVPWNWLAQVDRISVVARTSVEAKRADKARETGMRARVSLLDANETEAIASSDFYETVFKRVFLQDSNQEIRQQRWKRMPTAVTQTQR
jgi:hypothetical protein